MQEHCVSLTRTFPKDPNDMMAEEKDKTYACKSKQSVIVLNIYLCCFLPAYGKKDLGKFILYCYILYFYIVIMSQHNISSGMWVTNFFRPFSGTTIQNVIFTYVKKLTTLPQTFSSPNNFFCYKHIYQYIIFKCSATYIYC